MRQKIKQKVLTLVLAIAALAVGQNAWATGTFTVTNTSGTSKFVITRTSNTSTTETVYYRTVSLSAIAGQHFTDKYGSLTFDANNNAQEVEIEESTPSSDVYKYQTTTSRSYRFEVLDPGGFRLAYTDRTITTGTSVPSSGLFNEKTITIYTSEVQYSDAGYDQTNNPHYIESSAYYGLTNIAPKAYYTLIGAELRSTLSFDAKEKNNGYQYVQILINNITDSDNRSKCDDGDPGNISLSRYMAGFDHDPGDKNTNYAAYTFPVLSQPNNCSALTNAWSNGIDNILYTQKFNTNCRATDGRLILPLDFEKLVVRFNASGGGTDHDEWLAKNVKAHIQAVDGTAPTVSGTKQVNGGRHSKGNTIYVSVPFSEIVTVSGTPKLTTTWGTLSYTAGSGSNVLTFSGTISDDASGAFTISSYSGTIQDLAGNSLSGTISGTLLNANNLEGSYAYPITYNDLADGTVEPANPSTYTYNTSTFTLNNPTRTGYDFDGWTGSNGTTPSTAVTIANHSHGDKSYTANWTVHTYTVRFHSNDGTNATADQSFTYDVAQNLTANAFTLTGYTFDHWATTGSGNGITYTDGQSVSNLTPDDGATVNLYAQWTANNYTVTLDNQNATGAGTTEVTATFDASLPAINVPVRTGYTFGGYYTEANGGGIKYYNTDGTSANSWNIASPTTLYAQWTDVWGITNGANGSSGKPYVITTTVGLDLLAKNVNGTDGYTANNFSNTYFKLGNDITYTHTTDWNDATSTENNYTAIGINTSICFQGHFDGCGHTVSGIRIYRDTYNGNQGLFGHVIWGSVKNVTLTDARITGYRMVGGIVGCIQYNPSQVENCIVYNSEITANMEGGAIVGSNYNGIYTSNYYHGCIVNVGSNSYTSGIGIGDPRGDIDGACSVHSLTLGTDITASGETVTIGTDTYYAAGTTVTLGYSQAVTQQIIYHYNDGSDHAVTGNTFTMPASDATVSVSFTAAWSGSGTKSSPYLITTTDQLDLLAKMVNGTGGYTKNDFSNKYFKLGNDITYTHTTDWNDATSTENNYTAIGGYGLNFEGVFDGDGHTISGIRIYMSGSDNKVDGSQGLFGKTYVGTVKNVTLTDARITGYCHVGGIIGQRNYGQVENCHVTNTVAIHAVVNSSTNHGGIVGYNITSTSSYKISNCTSAATISIADGLTGCSYYGGIAGRNNYGLIENCLVLGATVSGNSNVAAIVGYDYNGTYTSNYYHGCTVNGTANATSVGVGCQYNGPQNPYDCDGARSVHSLTLGTDITATGESVEIGGTTYYASNTTVTLNVPAGYAISSASYNDGTDHDITGNTFTMPASDITVTATFTMTWASLKSAMQNGGMFTLPNDITATETDTYLYVPSGKTVTLDLNGHTIDRHLAEATANGYVMLVNGTLTINDGSAAGTGTITGGNCSSNGGGVYVDGGTLTITGGAIDGNTAKFDGGVCVVNNGAFTMSGGTITNNTEKNGYFSCGVSVYTNSTFTMTGGAVTGNIGSYGVYVDSDNTFTMSNGTISNHTKCGVTIIDGTFTMSGGTITNNTDTTGGGGVSVNGGTFAMTGGTITGNAATGNGGGVYVFGTFEISGNPVITGNTQGANGPADNVYLDSGSVITVTGALENSTPIGVTMEDGTGVFTSGLSGKGTAANFTSDNSAYGIYLNGDGEATLIDNVWGIANGADGSEAHPYIITTTAGLDLLATCVNDNTASGFSSDGFTGKFFKLGANITYDNENDNLDNTENNFTAIGHSNIRSFRGTFDGDGHTIRGIRIYKGEDNQSCNNQGLFGYVYGGTVKNVTLTDARITGRNQVGGIVGYLTNYSTTQTSTIDNCHVDGTVIIRAVVNSAEYHGGIVGWNYDGTVSNCTSGADLLIADGLTGCSNYGGIAGRNYEGATISHCLASHCYIPDVSSNGAIAGHNYVSSSGKGILTANYYKDCQVGGKTTGVGCNGIDRDGARSVHQLQLRQYTTATGESIDIDGITCYAAGTTVTLSCTATLPEGFIFHGYKVNGTLISGNTFTMPAEKSEAESYFLPDADTYLGGGDGTENNPYIITTVAGLNLVSKAVSLYCYPAGTHFLLGADIAYDPNALTFDNDDDGVAESNYVPIGKNNPFEGCFDGQGHTVSGIRCLTTSNCGLFGQLSHDDCYIKNVTVADAVLNGNGNTGAIAGFNNIGLIENCRAVGVDITCSNTFTGAIVGLTTNGLLSHNYYFDCTVTKSGTTSTTNIGTGMCIMEGQQAPVYGDVTSRTNGGITYTDCAVEGVALADNADNSTVISNNTGTGKNVMLYGRTLWKDGAWNTICLPFDVSTTSGPLAGDDVVAMTLNTTTSGVSGTTLTLNFTAAETIPAGTPFIIKWGTPESHPNGDLVNPVFTGVTIEDEAPADHAVVSADQKVSFIGTYEPLSFNSEDKSILFLGASNTLYYPQSGASIRAFRAYFQLSDGAGVKEFRLNFGDDDADGIGTIDNGQLTIDNEADAWYDLDGRKFSGKPTQKGIYINNGRKIIIK